MNRQERYTELLLQMLSVPALSREEHQRADFLENYFRNAGIPVRRIHNNLIAGEPDEDGSRRTILLNSHIDTVPPTGDWTTDPFKPVIEGNKITALGSNDAGASVVALIWTFEDLREKVQDRLRLLLVLSAEEEVSGSNGIASLVGQLKGVDGAIIGEPTSMQPAVAERGLMVIDAEVHGRPGHTARNEGDNAIYKALKDIMAIRQIQFPGKSEWLPDPSIQVTMIESGMKHNIVPDLCKYVIDVRSNDCYSNQQLLELLRETCGATLHPRSLHLGASILPVNHCFHQAIRLSGLEPFGSLTLSDMALLPFPAVKMGPGHSSRSHTADEYIYIGEIEKGVMVYTRFINSVYTILKHKTNETMG
ncbi:MAG: M20/M25/M40 family metallo-hydrolase [Bacteroidales bacterium]|nr:M20/M25/M40 family metallo-hydrolase [Bacteroidales bacterium]MBN2697613.1 M20/M25/M40 family metallo-hydrolase [Bacteroidales bacterium]